MTGRNPPALEDVFHTLDCWRHLPAYRLEPVLSPFFGLFLHDILRCKFEITRDAVIIPEFPLHINTHPNTREKYGKEDTERNLSVKIDYAIFEECTKRIYLVEMKSDEDSFDHEQFDRLIEVRDCRRVYDIIGGLFDIYEATQKKEKYCHLLYQLACVSVISFSEQSLRDESLNMAFSRDSICQAHDWGIEIVYITPNGTKPAGNGITNIGFDCVANMVENCGHFGLLFANYLRKWTKQAGEEDPRTIRTAR